MQFSGSASSHTRTQANKDRSTLDPDIPSPSDSLVPLVHVNPAFDCQVCSSPLPVLGRHSRERWGGEEVRTSLTSTATCADFHDLLSVRHRFVGSIPAWPHLAHHRQRAGSRFSRPQLHFDPALWQWDNVVWDSSPTAATACCALVDEVLRDSVEWWTFTQNFASSASILMLQTRHRWLASKVLVSFVW